MITKNNRKALINSLLCCCVVVAITLSIGSSVLRAQAQVNKSTDALGRTFQRLSTGQRINRASDDAAGLSVASTLANKAKLYTVALRNVNDGFSLLSVAGSTTGEQTNIVGRLYELAEQSANGTFSANQRSALNTE